MATYEYSCEQCKREYEVSHSIKDELSECPKCREDGNSSPPPKRLISMSSFHLVGGCWAKDRYS